MKLEFRAIFVDGLCRRYYEISDCCDVTDERGFHGFKFFHEGIDSVGAFHKTSFLWGQLSPRIEMAPVPTEDGADGLIRFCL